VLNRAIRQGIKDYEENTAAQTEFEKRAETTAAKMEVFRNRVNEAAISIGEALAPALKDALEASQPFLDLIQRLADAFADLPRPVQTFGLALAGMAIIAGPLLFTIGGIASGINAIGLAAQFAAPYVASLVGAL